MTTRAGKWLWRRLGGEVGDDDQPRPHDDDLVVIFTGIPERARFVKDRLEEAGFVIVANARVADPRGFAVEMGVSAKPSEVDLEIRRGDFSQAKAILDDRIRLA